MSKHHHQEIYKGILIEVRRERGYYYGSLLDIEYSFTTGGDTQEEVLESLINYIDSIGVNKD